MEKCSFQQKAALASVKGDVDEIKTLAVPSPSLVGFARYKLNVFSPIYVNVLGRMILDILPHSRNAAFLISVMLASIITSLSCSWKEKALSFIPYKPGIFGTNNLPFSTVPCETPFDWPDPVPMYFCPFFVAKMKFTI